MPIFWAFNSSNRVIGYAIMSRPAILKTGTVFLDLIVVSTSSYSLEKRKNVFLMTDVYNIHEVIHMYIIFLSVA